VHPESADRTLQSSGAQFGGQEAKRFCFTIAGYMLLKTLQHWFRFIHQHLRAQKVKLFFDTIQPAASETILDLGGGPGFAGEFERLYSFFDHVIVLNLRPPLRSDHKCVFVSSDARYLPFPDKSIDWVFSNAVIEHVGTWQDQMMMATEIQRVARKGYFIATPNRFFPIDPHTYLPFFHLLPSRARWYVGRSLLYPLLEGRKEYAEYRMLSRQDLARLFPQATIFFRGGRTSLIAAWIVPERPSIFGRTPKGPRQSPRIALVG